MAKVTCRRYFQLSLLLPVIAGVLGYIVPKFEALLFFFAIGGVPYVAIAVALFFLIGKAKSIRHLAILSALVPPIYGVAFASFIGFLGHKPGTYTAVAFILNQGLEAATLGAIIAALYVGLAWLLWMGGREMELITNEFAT